MAVKIAKQVLPVEVTVPNEFADWVEEEKAVVWTEVEVIGALYSLLLDKGVPEETARSMCLMRYQQMLMSQLETQ